MSSKTFSLTCTSSNERERALFSSLIGTFGKPSQNIRNEWQYVSSGYAEVAIVDFDDEKPSYPAVVQGKPLPVIIGYSAQPDKLKGSSFALPKPARGRDFVKLLEALDSYLSHKDDKTVPLMRALGDLI